MDSEACPTSVNYVCVCMDCLDSCLYHTEMDTETNSDKYTWTDTEEKAERQKGTAGEGRGGRGGEGSTGTLETKVDTTGCR